MINGPSGIYEIWIGERPHKFVHGNDLPAAMVAITTPYREWEFEDASIPVSKVHSEIHSFLAQVKMMQFDSAYSNTARTTTEGDRQKEVERIESMMRDRIAKEAIGETPATKTRKPSGPNGGGGVPDWANGEA